MNISYNWLKEYVDFDLSAEEVAKALTSIGLDKLLISVFIFQMIAHLIILAYVAHLQVRHLRSQYRSHCTRMS